MDSTRGAPPAYVVNSSCTNSYARFWIAALRTMGSAAEKTFKPELGFDFSTYLGGFARDGRLKELHRLHDKLEKEDGVEIQAEEDGEPTDSVNFAGGGNGVRLVFDLQWWEAWLLDIACHFEGVIGPMFRKASAHPVDEGVREPRSNTTRTALLTSTSRTRARERTKRSTGCPLRKGLST
jgi:hypothetical protein